MRSRSAMTSTAPTFLYGTAWKEEQTEWLVRQALQAGFRGIDTANQRRHYFEAGVGSAIAAAIADGIVQRDELFLQTKFTYVDGQDHRLPYDGAAAVSTQVAQSFASSLDHLQVERIDSYVLHGPSRGRGLGAVDLQAWQAMEDVHRAGRTRHLGISNVALDQLEELWERATVRPTFVQNRCFAATGWDRQIRRFCKDHDVVYQGFSLLTANVNELRRPAMRPIVERTQKTVAQVVFRFSLQIGIVPLTGTTDPHHMREDLDIQSFELSEDEVATIERIAG
jgi:diketogulonate reductase-like aldo/keto reductase